MTLLKRKGTIALCALLLCIPPLAPAKIVFKSKRDGRGIYVMDDDGSNVQRLTFPSPHESDGSPAWSYDGARIVFDRNVSAKAQQIELFVMGKDGSNVEQLTYDKVLSGEGSWAPDGNRIAFSSDKSGGFEIYVMDYSTGAVTQLTRNPGNKEWAGGPSWSPDGKHIAYRQATAPHGLTTIYVMRPDGTGQFQRSCGTAGIPDVYLWWNLKICRHWPVGAVLRQVITPPVRANRTGRTV